MKQFYVIIGVYTIYYILRVSRGFQYVSEFKVRVRDHTVENENLRYVKDNKLHKIYLWPDVIHIVLSLLLDNIEMNGAAIMIISEIGYV